MLSKEVHRFASFTGDYTFKKIDEIVAANKGVSKAGLLEILVLGLEAQKADLTPIIAAGKARRKEVNPDMRKGRTDVLARLSRLPKERLAELLAEAESQEPPAP